MKVEIKDFGPIHQFEIDLDKKINLVYGKNSIGKSYAMYVVYGVMSTINKEYLHNVINSKGDPKSFDDLAELGKLRLSLTEYLNNTFTSLESLYNLKSKKDFCFSLNTNYFSLSFRDGKKGVLKSSISSKSTKHSSKRPELLDYYFLPSSRSGLAIGMGSFASIMAKLSQLRHHLKGEKIDIPTFSEPVSDYYLNLSSISNGKKSPFQELINEFEQDVLGGKVRMNDETKKLVFQPTDYAMELEMGQASSMVSELMPIIAYLKYIVEPNSILIIEEPEAHLHPEVQVKLMEFFVKLSKAGVRLILTSHSNYMFNKIGNMLLADDIEPEEVGVHHLVMTDKGSVDMKDMLADDYGMDDHNFSEVSEMLYEERVQLYEKKNEEE